MTRTATAIGNLSITAAVLLGGVSSSAQSQPRRVLQRTSERHELFQDDSHYFVPAWQGRALLGVEKNNSDEPVIYGIDKDGQMERIAFSFPGGRYLTIGPLAGSPDGSIALVGGAYSKNGQPGTFLARIAPDRSRKLVVQLWPYVANAVTISSDGVMWTVGFLKTEDNEGVVGYNVLKRFDASGKLLTTATVPAQSDGRHRGDATTASLLRASKDRVGWSTNGNEYIEFGLDGHELGRFPPPPVAKRPEFFATLALSDDNEVLLGTAVATELKVWSLDRVKRSWESVEPPGAKLTGWATLGFDGDSVVVVDDKGSSGATVARYTFSTIK